jgi:hypothetical protein
MESNFMFWSLIDMFRRPKVSRAPRATAKRKAAPRRRQLLLELLEERTVPSTYTASQNFNPTAVPAGDTLWFSSVISGVGGMGTSPATVTVTNQTITFTDSTGGTFNVSVPNAVLTLTPGATSAATAFNSSLNQWTSNDPSNLGGNLFLSAVEVPLPSGLHGGDAGVSWSATFTTDTSGLNFKWAWSAAAYNSFSTYGNLGVKPCDNNTASIYPNGDKAGTPESYKTHVVGGATGGGGSNTVGNLSPNQNVTPTYSPVNVTLAGTVYQDTNQNGVFDNGTATITQVALTNNVATLTAANNFTVGDILAISGLHNSVFNGIFTVTAVTSSTFSFALQNSNVSATSDNGTASTNEAGISGISLTLTGTTTGGQSVTATATTASDGTYTFATDSNGNKLVAGTYQIVETQPAGYYQGSNTVGTVNGTTDGSLTAAGAITSIALTVGQNSVGNNFGEVNPYNQVAVTYPYTSGNPLTSVAFNESEVLAGASVNVANGTFNIFYSDEHAMALGVRQVNVLLNGSTVNGSKTVTVGTSGRTVGEAVSGTGIAAGTTISVVGATTITLSSSATATGTTKLTFTTNYNVSPLSTDPGSATNPAVGTTATTGDQAGTDASGRLIAPSLYITDITANANSTSGDWQNGGTATAPNAVYGAWKGFVTTVDHTTSPATITQTADTDPTANGWNLGTGADPVPSSIAGSNAGYGTEAQWSLSSLYNQGLLIPGHNYRFYFIVHDGDQNQSGGDCGQVAYDFTYRGPVTIAGNVYKDVYGNGVDGAGDSGIGGVAMTLTGTTSTGTSVTATTTTAADGTYTFTKDSNGNLLHGGTYQIAETQPSGYLQGINTVGLTSWATGFQTALASLNTSGTGSSPGYTHEAGSTTSDSVFTGVGSLDTSGVGQWKWTTGAAAASNDIVDAFGVNFNDSLTGHNFLLGGMDRYAATAGTTVGFWAFQNSLSVNANGTFSGVHTNGDLLFVITYSGSGPSAVSVYKWTGTDASGSLTPVTPPVGATYVFANTLPTTVPWSFIDSVGNTSPQAGELLEFGVDLNAIFGLTVPHFASFLTETRSSSAAGATLLDFAAASLNSVAGSFTADGTLIPVDQIGNIVINDGQNGINYNFGEVQPVTIAGLVYHDTNGNGVLDSGEPGIPGVTVTVSGTNNLGQAVTATTTTASDGSYSFTTDSTGKLLAPGTYQVVETQPSGYLPGTTAVGTVNGTADGTVVSTGTIGSVVLTTGQNGVSYNFGEYKPVTVSGQVYQDSNGNGALDSGEPGIAGVTLTLSGTNGLGQPVTATTTTIAGGAYSFTTDGSGNPLRPGTYKITETLPSGYLQGTTAVGTVNGTADGTVITPGQIGSIAMTSGQSGANYNFGNVQPVTVSGLVYVDTNGNGVLNSGEPSLAGVTLTLSGTNGLGQAITATTTTGSGGTYSFTTDTNGNPLRPGTYQVVETVPNGYLASGATVGTVNSASDGTASSTTKISAIGLTSGQSRVNYNFGVVQAVTLGGLVYTDTNGNGVLDSGEPGIAGVTLTLSGTNGLGQPITATTTTGSGGTYSFTTDSSGNALRPGTYQITETAPNGYLLGSAAVGTVNGTADGTASSATNISSIVLTSGQNGINYYFGDVKAVTVSGLVYQDTNGNGALNSGEPGISGVTLTLSGTNNLGQPITATTTTGSGGTYSFSTDSNGNALRPGNYQIVETQPNGYLLGSATVGTVNGTADGTVASATKISSIVLTSGQSGINYYFGDVQPVVISGTVYVDSNGNGALDSGEPGMSGITLTLSGTNGLGQPITATVTTGSDGTYSFLTDNNGNALRPGTYQVTETQPTGYLPGTTAVGTVNGSTDGTVVSTGKIGSIVLTSGQSGANYNFGNFQPITVAGLVYVDTNGNGVQDSGEPSLAGVTLTLSGTNGLGQAITATTTTGSGGTYSFSTDSNGNVLRPGTYQVVETVPNSYLASGATVGTVNGTSVGTANSASKISAIALTSGQSGINYNFGDVQAVALSGLVYVDTNGNGVKDSGEPGLAGVTLTLSGTNGLGQSITATTTTGSGGTYSFTTDSNGASLRPGTYQITETVPNGYLPGATVVGTVNGNADGTVVSSGIIGSIVLTSGQNGSNYIFGDVKAISISGEVYQDSNGNGVLNSGEPGIVGVTVTLSGTNNLGQSITATTTTDTGGLYSFSTDSTGAALRPGTYQVVETQPNGYLLGSATVGTVNGTTDGTAASGTTIASIALTSAQSGVNYNFGDVLPVSLSGKVYTDVNGNGALDAGDTAMSGITLTLSGTNGLGQPITATTTTGSDGTYNFATDSTGASLRPGTYQITETQPNGYLAGTTSVGTVNGTTDGTVVSNGQIGSIVLTSGQAGVSYNFGEVQPVTIKGLVYIDPNGSGTYSATDSGFANVTLTLSGTNGLGTAITATTTTAADGSYTFSTDSKGNVLLPGTYQITASTPSGYVAVAANVGTVNGTVDGTEASPTTISSIALTSDQNGINYLFGVSVPASASGSVYLDFDGSQTFDSNNVGFSGITVVLTGTTSAGQSVNITTTTDVNGFYIFANLANGTYTITMVPPGGVYSPDAANVGTVNGTTDGVSNANLTEIDQVKLHAGQTGVNYNFGLQPPFE